MTRRHVCHITGRHARQYSLARWEDDGILGDYDHLMTRAEHVNGALIGYSNLDSGERRMTVVDLHGGDA